MFAHHYQMVSFRSHPSKASQTYCIVQNIVQFLSSEGFKWTLIGKCMTSAQSYNDTIE